MKKEFVLFFTALLFAAALVFGGVFSGCKTSDNNGNGGDQEGIFEKVSVIEAYGLIQNNLTNPEFVIMDVRTAEEFGSGHIEGAVNIDFYASSFESQLDMLDKEKVYLVYCRSSNRGGQTMEKMENMGFAEVYNMSGGINAWNNAGYATVK